MSHLHDTPFMRELADRNAATLRETVDELNLELGEFTRPFTRQEEYIAACLVSAAELVVACDQMQYSLTYLSGYRSRKTDTGELITRTDYLAYQLENLYLRIGMLLDRSLKLTNTVFQLGIPPRACSTRTVTDNGHVRGTPVRERLRAINKAVQPFLQVRNIIAHDSRYNDAALNKVEAYFILEKSNHVYQDPLVERFRWLYKMKTDSYVEEKRSELAPAIAGLLDLVSQLFETMLPTFRSRAGGP
jgi:Cthe_2314-like HEPN